jgi:hypothetical protein
MNNVPADMSFIYNVTAAGPATLIDNGDPASLNDTTPLLATGQTFTPPGAALAIPQLTEWVQEVVTYQVSALQDPYIVESVRTVITLEPPQQGGPLTAEVIVAPRTLNLESRGRWVTGRIELPAAFLPEEIDIATVLLQDTIPAVPDKWVIEDCDQDGIRELVVKFDRAFFQEIMPQGEYVPVTIGGMVGDREFIGEDTIRTIRPTIKHPSRGVVPLGELIAVTWTSPDGYAVDYVDVHWTHDDGQSWQPIAEGIPDAGTVGWHTPDAEYDSCRVMITLYADSSDFGMGMSPEKFLISNRITVTLENFTGALEEDHVVLRWRTVSEFGIIGFHVLRAETGDGEYICVTDELIPTRGDAGGASYEMRDTSVELNKRYFYKIEAVTEYGTVQVLGPFEIAVTARFSLEQNVPNPFNPATTIRFTVPEPCHVRLDIFDVSGRRVRSLVDKPLRAGKFHAVWDGTNDGGKRVASGIYFYRLAAGKHRDTKKMILLR